jgi:predicted amidohydrolase YtcJ
MFASTILMAQPHASLVLLSGNIHTMNPAMPHADAVAVIGSRIVEVGGNDEIRKWVGPQTRVVDLHGRLVVPGFNDAHVHFFQGGQALASVQLRSARSPEEFRNRIAEFSSHPPAGRWVLNGWWDHENWSPARLPTRQLIDDVTRDRPVFVSRLDGHMGLANGVALKLAAIDRSTPDPPGGTIVRDEHGEPTGILKDAAIDLIVRAIPAPSLDEITESVRAAMHYAAENGVTSVQDMATSVDALPAGQKLRGDVMRVYESLLRHDELTVRISVHRPLALWEQLATIGVTAPFGGEKLHIGGLKAFADGSLGSSTALFFHPYLDAPETSGLAAEDMIPVSRMQERIVAADAAGLQVAIHAIGDKANKTILDLYEEAKRRNGPRDRRFRIEHAQHLRREDIPRFAALHVIASMQPLHLADDGRWAEKRVGPEVIRGTYAFRSLLDSGATLAFGSDWPVAPMIPLQGIWAAVTRQTLDGKHPDGWVPEQKISVEEAVRAFTVGSAYASFEERTEGSIEVGKLADMAVISSDIFQIAPPAIRDARVDMTIFDGRVVYERGAK